VIKKLKAKKEFRYLVVIIILAGVMIFGRNFNFQSEQQGLVNEISDLNRNARGYYQAVSEGDLVISGKINSAPDEFVVISFNALSREKSFKQSSEVPEKISVVVSSDLGDQKIIGDFTPKVTLDLEKIEFQFTSDKNYRDLIIRKTKNDNFHTEISAIRVDKYAIPQNNELVENYYGYSKPEKMVSIDNNKQDYIRLWRKNQKVGEIFTADSDNLYGGEFEVRFQGTGGKGSYLIEVREIDDNDKISGERLAYWYFDKRQLESLGQISKNTYFIPIVAKLEKGKKYYLGFSSAEVSNNWFNSVEILLGKKVKKIKDPIDNSSISLRQQSHNLYFLKNSSYSGEKLLFGSSISIASNKKTYRYIQLGRPAEYLDIYRVEGERAKYSVLYDNVSGGIAGQLSKGTAIIYRFNTGINFNRAFISFQEVAGGYCGVRAFWSYDDKNWQEISGDNFSNPNNPMNFKQSIAGVGGSEIFLKITYDPERQHNKKINLFGISDLSLVAE